MAMKNPATDAARIIRSFAHNSPGFVEQFFGVTPDPWQREALEAIDAGKCPAIRSGHGVGKTALLAWITIQTLACFPYAKIPCTAPTQHQLRDLLWAEIALWLNASPLRDLMTWTATGLAMNGFHESWFAVARSSNRPENLAGFHAPKLRYIVDEASGVGDEIMAVVDGALTTDGAQVIMAGNPTRTSGYFYDAFHRSRADWHCINVSSIDSPRVNPEYPARMARKWGANTDIYRVRVLGDFPNAESDAFIPLALVERAMQRWHDAKPEPTAIFKIGLDVARYGSDETVFALAEGTYIHPLEAHRQWSTVQTAGRAGQLWQGHKAAIVNVDDTGVGGGVTDILRDAGVPTRAINFGGAGDEHYDDYATIMWANVRSLLQDDDLALPDDEDLAAQLTTRKYVITRKGKIRLESKDSCRQRELPSPDRADALVLALAPPDKARRTKMRAAVGGKRSALQGYRPR